jgi:hypothetical protein
VIEPRCADPAGTIGFFLCQAGQRLRGAAIEAPRLEARRLLAHVLNTSEEALLRDPRAPVPAEKAAHFAGLLARRIAHEPFAYLVGRVGFWTLELEVSPATLIPRADSESLIEAAALLWATGCYLRDQERRVAHAVAGMNQCSGNVGGVSTGQAAMSVSRSHFASQASRRLAPRASTAGRENAGIRFIASPFQTISPTPKGFRPRRRGR